MSIFWANSATAWRSSGLRESSTRAGSASGTGAGFSGAKGVRVSSGMASVLVWSIGCPSSFFLGGLSQALPGQHALQHGNIGGDVQRLIGVQVIQLLLKSRNDHV